MKHLEQKQPLRNLLKEEGLSPREFCRLTGLSATTLDWNMWGLYNSLPTSILEFFDDPDLPYLQTQYRLQTRLETSLDYRPSDLAGKPRLVQAKLLCIQPAQILRYQKNERALPTDLHNALSQMYPEANPVYLAEIIFKSPLPL